MKPGLVLQHGPSGPTGLFGDWLAARGREHVVHRSWEDPVPSDPTAYAWIASLGSEHSAAATDPAWITDEIALLRAAVDAGVPVLGLCFGGQALSVALGGGVRPAVPPEIGWLKVRTADPERIAAGPWLQFHHEVLDVPPGATELARSPAGPAAFALGPHLGLQFHPEATPEIVDVWARATGRDHERLRADGERASEGVRERAYALFDRWLKREGVESAG